MDPATQLRTARRRAGLTQRQLAARTGVTQPRIAEYERGRAVPRADRFLVLLDGCQGVVAEPDAGPPGVSEEDLQLLTLHLSMTPAERLATFCRLNRLRGAARRTS